MKNAPLKMPVFKRYADSQTKLRLPAKSSLRFIKSEIISAISQGNLAKLEQLVEQHGQSVLVLKDKQGNSMLHLAIKAGQQDITIYLIQKSINLNSTDLNQKTPLHLAVELKQIKVVKALIQAGVQLDKRNKSSEPPLVVAIKTEFQAGVLALMPYSTCNIPVDLIDGTIFHFDNISVVAAMMKQGFNPYQFATATHKYIFLALEQQAFKCIKQMIHGKVSKAIVSAILCKNRARFNQAMKQLSEVGEPWFFDNLALFYYLIIMYKLISWLSDYDEHVRRFPLWQKLQKARMRVKYSAALQNYQRTVGYSLSDQAALNYQQALLSHSTLITSPEVARNKMKARFVESMRSIKFDFVHASRGKIYTDSLLSQKDRGAIGIKVRNTVANFSERRDSEYVFGYFLPEGVPYTGVVAPDLERCVLIFDGERLQRYLQRVHGQAIIVKGVDGAILESIESGDEYYDDSFYEYHVDGLLLGNQFVDQTFFELHRDGEVVRGKRLDYRHKEGYAESRVIYEQQQIVQHDHGFNFAHDILYRLDPLDDDDFNLVLEPFTDSYITSHSAAQTAIAQHARAVELYMLLDQREACVPSKIPFYTDEGELLLKDAKTLVNVDSPHLDELEKALVFGQIERAKLIIAKQERQVRELSPVRGVHYTHDFSLVNLRLPCKRTPLMIAAEKDLHQLVEYLIQIGSSRYAKVELEEKLTGDFQFGKDALTLAESYQSLNSLKLLLDFPLLKVPYDRQTQQYPLTEGKSASPVAKALAERGFRMRRGKLPVSLKFNQPTLESFFSISFCNMELVVAFDYDIKRFFLSSLVNEGNDYLLDIAESSFDYGYFPQELIPTVIYADKNFLQRPYPDIAKAVVHESEVKYGPYTVYRPNHGLLHSLRQAALIVIVHEFLIQYGNSHIHEQLKVIDVKKLQACILFSATGRRNEDGWADNLEAYKSFRSAAGENFARYFSEQEPDLFTPEELNEYKYHAVDMGNPKNENIIHIVLNLVHKLDLLRCCDMKEAKNRIVLELLRYCPNPQAADELLEFSSRLLEVTGDRVNILAGRDEKEFVRLSFDLPSAVKEINSVVPPEFCKRIFYKMLPEKEILEKLQYSLTIFNIAVQDKNWIAVGQHLETFDFFSLEPEDKDQIIYLAKQLYQQSQTQLLARLHEKLNAVGYNMTGIKQLSFIQRAANFLAL